MIHFYSNKSNFKTKQMGYANIKTVIYICRCLYSKCLYTGVIKLIWHKDMHKKLWSWRARVMQSSVPTLTVITHLPVAF